MGLVDSIRSFADAHRLAGPLLWMASLQYFIVQPIVAWTWRPEYSWTNNVISNLGNTNCQQSIQASCSPLAYLMNTSFILLGVTMLTGAVLIYCRQSKSLINSISFAMIALGGVGSVMVGVFPENSIGILHLIGAVLALAVANLGLIMLSFGLKSESSWLRVYAFVTGLVALMSLILFAVGWHEPLGVGTLERLASYLYVIWLIIYGAVLVYREVK